MNVSELFVEIGQWAVAKGAENIGGLPGLWVGETPEWTVEINGHAEEIDGLPFCNARLAHKQYLQVAIVSPRGGAIGGGATEDDLITHFRREREALETSKS